MAQHDYIISNQTFPNTRADLNNVLQAIATCNKGSSAPTTQYAGQMWIDDSAGTTWTLYLYDGSDNIQVATIDTNANTINFIDSVVSGFDIVTDTTPQLGGDLDTNGNNINFGDNDKAVFGTGNDLEIYHNGTHSYISDQGTGNLVLQASNSFKVENSGGTETYIFASENGAVELKHDNSTKLATTSTGVDVTGTVTSDGLTVDTDTLHVDSTNNRVGVGTSSPDRSLHINTPSTQLKLQDSGQTDSFFEIVDSAGVVYMGSRNNTNNGQFVFRGLNSGGASEYMRLDSSGNAIFKKGALLEEGTLTDGATIAWDVNASPVAKVTLGGNRTISAPSNSAGAGQFISLLVIQDGTGSRTLTWNAVYEFASDTAPTLTTTGGQGDLFVFRYNGTKWLEVGRNLNLSLS
jgi:hypothetical protein